MPMGAEEIRMSLSSNMQPWSTASTDRIREQVCTKCRAYSAVWKEIKVEPKAPSSSSARASLVTDYEGRYLEDIERLLKKEKLSGEINLSWHAESYP